MKSKIVLILLIIFLKSSSCISQDFWEEVIIPDSISPAYISFNNNSELYLTSSNGLYKSSDGGSSWNLLINCMSGLSVLNRGQDEIFVGIDSFGKLFHSLDDGMTWDTISTEIVGGWLVMINDTILFCRDWGAIYKSIDIGYSWDTVLATSNTEIFNDIIKKDTLLFSGSTAFLNPQGGGINQSLNGGNSWQQISLPGYGVSSFDLDQDGNLLCGVNFQYNYEAFGVFRSTDDGFIWENILPGYIVTSLAVDINGGIYAGCDSDFGPEGIQYSSDNGMTWSDLNNGLHDDASIKTLTFSPDGYVYCITKSPFILYRSINPIVQINEKPPIVNSIIIYPNPFQNKFMIHFNEKLAGSEKIHVRLVNIRGITIFDENLKPSTNEMITVSQPNLNEGLYILLVMINDKLFSSTLIKN
jgi:photosystem II stability/assembly factor-like uncharacterized protein